MRIMDIRVECTGGGTIYPSTPDWYTYTFVSLSAVSGGGPRVKSGQAMAGYYGPESNLLVPRDTG